MATLQEILTYGEWTDEYPARFGGGVNNVFKLPVALGGQTEVALYKDGGTQECDRDALAAFLARLTGLVTTPVGALREAPRHSGLCQPRVWAQELVADTVEPTYCSPYPEVRQEALDMCVFDVLTGNRDRHRWNYLLRREGPRRLVAIDHGLCFGSAGNHAYTYLNAWRYELQDEFGHLYTLDSGQRAAIKRVLDQWWEVEDFVLDLDTNMVNLAGVKRRARYLLDTGIELAYRRDLREV